MHCEGGGGGGPLTDSTFSFNNQVNHGVVFAMIGRQMTNDTKSFDPYQPAQFAQWPKLFFIFKF